MDATTVLRVRIKSDGENDVSTVARLLGDYGFSVTDVDGDTVTADIDKGYDATVAVLSSLAYNLGTIECDADVITTTKEG